MQDFMAAAWWGVLIACAIAATVGIYFAIRNRRRWMPELEELVTLDSRGWHLVALVSTAGAVVMIGTSQLFSSNYWIGLALDSEGKSWPTLKGGWEVFLSVGVIAALALSIIFELVSDIGAPAASGLKKEKKRGIPEMLLIATAFSIVMSLASKWGYYEDRRQVRAEEAASIAAEDTNAATQLADANATIERLRATPAAEAIDTRAKSVEDRLADARAQRADAIAARDALPANQGTNKLAFQNSINEFSDTIESLEKEKIEIEAQRADLAALKAARDARDSAQAKLAADSGKLTEDRRERVKIGDTILIRLIRSVLHQALCFLFPIIALEAWTAHRKKKTAEEAAAKAAATRRRNSAADIAEAAPEPPAEDEGPRFGGYLASDTGETPDSAEEAGGDLSGEGFEGEPPSDDPDDDKGR